MGTKMKAPLRLVLVMGLCIVAASLETFSSATHHKSTHHHQLNATLDVSLLEEEGSLPPRLWDTIKDQQYKTQRANWFVAVRYCQIRSLRLCPYSVYCPNGPGKEPRFGKPTGDQWAPTIDSRNSWISIGTANPDRLCQFHHAINNGAFGKPVWGVKGGWATAPVLCCGPPPLPPPLPHPLPMHVQQGEPGVSGIEGPAGIVGSKGPVGAPGVKGQSGGQGPMGAPGDRGLRGLPGPRGDIGEMGGGGPIGLAGSAGPTGPKGRNGQDGKKGPRGPDGDRGLQGNTGEPGEDGPKGIVGGPGPQGDRGIQGDQGEQGDIGPKGARGPKGKKGETGPPGPDGEYSDGLVIIRELIKEFMELEQSMEELEHILNKQELKDRWSSIIRVNNLPEQATKLGEKIVQDARESKALADSDPYVGIEAMKGSGTANVGGTSVSVEGAVAPTGAEGDVTATDAGV